MRKQLLYSIAATLIMALCSTTFIYSQPGKSKDKGGHGNGHSKNHDQPAPDDHGRKPRDLYMAEEVNLGAGNGHSAHGKANGSHGKGDDHDNHGKSDESHGKMNKHEGDEDFTGSTAVFKERIKARDHEKVTICHKTGNNNQPGVTINVSAMALQAHLSHGDTRGGCPQVKSALFSDVYLKKRTDYYDRLAKAEERVVYSRSLLDYARRRLENAKLQLAEMRRRKMRQEEIASREKVVLQLEQNTTLLGTLLSTAANLLVNKL